MFDPLLDNKIEEKTKQNNLFLKELKNYVNVFKNSRNPFTICWLVELLHLVSDKFNLRDDRLDKKLKLEYHELLNSMLSNQALIISDNFKISFTQQQSY